MAGLGRLISQVLDGKYRLDRLLGQGGMGAVFLATHLGTKRPVALKVIAPQLMTNEEVGERFHREAEAAGRLRHPNVVNVTDFGVADLGRERIAYLVMEYLDGSSLGDTLKEKGQLPLKFTVDIVEQVCLAIGAAHDQGIIHRDLKPDNIWLQPDRRGGFIVKVLDFGLAKLRDTPAGEAENDTGDFPNRVENPVPRDTIPAIAATRAHPPEQTNLEAETYIQPAPVTAGEGERTLLFDDAPAEEPEAATQMQIARETIEDDAGETRIQPAHSGTEHPGPRPRPPRTASLPGLSRRGAHSSGRARPSSLLDSAPCSALRFICRRSNAAEKGSTCARTYIASASSSIRCSPASPRFRAAWPSL